MQKSAQAVDPGRRNLHDSSVRAVYPQLDGTGYDGYSASPTSLRNAVSSQQPK